MVTAEGIFERDFCEFLIVGFSFEELVDAKQRMLQFRSYTKLDGELKAIVKEYKSSTTHKRYWKS